MSTVWLEDVRFFGGFWSFTCRVMPLSDRPYPFFRIPSLGFWILGIYPKGPCAQIVYTLALKCLCSEYFKAKVYTICWVLPPLSNSWIIFNIHNMDILGP